jgi:hypothetical protein
MTFPFKALLHGQVRTILRSSAGAWTDDLGVFRNSTYAGWDLVPETPVEQEIVALRHMGYRKDGL